MALAVVALLAGSPAGAQARSLENAEKLRRLDIMLMVTALRCRFGADNFQADYDAFATRHLAELNAAARTLTAELARRNGASGARRRPPASGAFPSINLCAAARGAPRRQA